jgi:hypothetical protein
MNPMKNTAEILKAAAELGVQCDTLDEGAARAHIDSIIDAFAPARTEGHLMIGHDSDDYPLEIAEWDYSLALPASPVLVFFDQSSTDRDQVIQLSDGPRLCEVLRRCFGMEYFATGIQRNYLIAVNWYVVEVTGIARAWLKHRYANRTTS